MKPTQAVTIVSSGGTPVQLADQRGAPYPTTGYGALVWNTGPYLIDAKLENPKVIGTIEGIAPIDSPIFTGDPQVPTPPVGDDDASIPNTGWVNDAIDAAIEGLPDAFPPSGPAGGDLTGFYPSPTLKMNIALLGNPTVTTPPPPGDDDSSIPTTAWVQDEIDTAIAALPPPPSTNWDDIPGKPATFPPSAHVHPESDITNLVADLALKAPLASPTFTGDPKAPTPATADNDTSVATTAFVKAQGYATTASIPTTLPPSGPAGGDLSGTYPNPTAIKASGAFAVTGILTAPTITAPAATSLVLNAPTGQRINQRINDVDIVQLQSNAMFPSATGAVDFGGASNRWNAIHAVSGTLSGTIPPSSNDTTVPTTAWVKANAGGGSASISVGPTPPATPTDGAMWYYSDAVASGGTLMIRYNDGNTSQWVPASPSMQTLSTALANYLPLAGGTLTGPLIGTTASFSGAIGADTVTAVSTTMGSYGISYGGYSGGLSGGLGYAAGSFMVRESSAVVSYFPTGTIRALSIISGGGAVGWSLWGQEVGPGNAWTIGLDSISDQRIKKDIYDTEVDALAVVQAIPVRQFTMRGDALTALQPTKLDTEGNILPKEPLEDAHVTIGLVTQEVQALIPEMVSTQPNASNHPALPDNIQAIIHQQAVPYLIKAIQQLTARVAELEARL